MQHHISLCFFSARALQQSGQRWGGGAERSGETGRDVSGREG